MGKLLQLFSVLLWGQQCVCRVVGTLLIKSLHVCIQPCRRVLFNQRVRTLAFPAHGVDAEKQHQKMLECVLMMWLRLTSFKSCGT
jgi:hypothetical protein